VKNLPTRTPQEQHVIAMARWLLIAVFIVIGYLVVAWAAKILGPILAALGIAYLLAPVATKLQGLGMSRPAAAGLLLVVFLAVVTTAAVLLVPMVIHDLADLIQDLPRLIDNLSAWLHNNFGVEVPADWRAYLKSDEVRTAFSDAVGPLSEGAQAAVTGLLHLLAFLGEMLLIPVFAFYFLADWDALLRRIKHLVPPRRRAAVVDTAVEIDRVIAGWVRGQGIVVICLMILYAVAFEVLGVPGGMPLGLIVGGLTVIPFVGTFVGAGLTAAIMLASSAATSVWLGAGIVFLVLHLLEAAVLTPKIVGHRVGLSESAALFAVVAGGKLLGFVGVVLAVPLAATVNVLLRKLVSYYEHTEFFGEEADAHVAVSPAMAMILPVEPTISVSAVTEGGEVPATTPTER